MYIDHQRITVGEPPESVPSGQMPRQVQAILEGELVDRVRLGDKIQIVGIVRPGGTKSRRKTKTIYDVEIYANNIEPQHS